MFKSLKEAQAKLSSLRQKLDAINGGDFLLADCFYITSQDGGVKIKCETDKKHSKFILEAVERLIQTEIEECKHYIRINGK